MTRLAFTLGFFLFSAVASARLYEPQKFQGAVKSVKPDKKQALLEEKLSPAQTVPFSAVSNWEQDKKAIKCLQDEMQSLHLERSLVQGLKEAFFKKDEAALKRLGTHQASFKMPGAMDLKGEYAGIKIFEPSSMNESWLEYLSAYAKIDSVEMDLIDLLVSPEDRLSTNSNFKKAQLKVRLDIRGTNKGGLRSNDQGFLVVSVEKAAASWKFSAIQAEEVRRVVATRAPAFNEITRDSGLAAAQVTLRTEAIRRGGYALAVADMNGDGQLDIFTGAYGEPQIFLGSGVNKWKSAPMGDLGTEIAVKTAIFSDYDNDGDKDAFLTKFDHKKWQSHLALYENSGNGQFRKSKSFADKPMKYDLPMPAAAADFDRDGFLDLYVGFPGIRDFTVMSNRRDESKSLQGVFRNTFAQNSAMSFSDETERFFNPRGVKMYSAVWPHSAISADLDLDNDQDLIVIDDRNNVSPVYQNEGGQFAAVNDSIDVKNKGYGMGAAVGDLNNDGKLDIAVTNVNFHALNRIAKSCNRHWYEEFEEMPGLRLYENASTGGKKLFKESTRVAGLDWVGQGAAGLEFVDYNSDGLLDVYVTNGLWSGNKNKPEFDLSSLFARAVTAGATQIEEVSSDPGYMDWSFVSVLRDSKAQNRPSMAGYQRNRLFLNTGKGEFIEVGYLEGVDSIYDGYIVATADTNGDGKMDLVLRNGDPGTSQYKFPTIQIFENKYPSNKSLTITLEGVGKSNRDAVGAILNLQMDDGRSFTRTLTSNNGAAQSQQIVHFGLGEANLAKALKVTWPSGKTQTFKNLKPGNYHLRESEDIIFASNFAPDSLKTRSN